MFTDMLGRTGNLLLEKESAPLIHGDTIGSKDIKLEIVTFY